MPEEKYIPCSKLPFKDKEIRRIFYGDVNNNKYLIRNFITVLSEQKCRMTLNISLYHAMVINNENEKVTNLKLNL